MFKKSLSSILSTFTKTAIELNTFIEKSNKEITILEDGIVALETKQVEVTEDVRQAQVALNNIKQILGE